MKFSHVIDVNVHKVIAVAGFETLYRFWVGKSNIHIILFTRVLL